MALIDLLHSSPMAFLIAVTVLGLMVGSFLNVVIYRLPLMMEQEWREQCAELSEQPFDDTTPKLTLSTPRSACPHCQYQLRAIDNIPILSYLFLRGRCRGCQQAISVRYPLIEAFTGLLSAIVAYHFGFTVACGGALLLTWALVALSFIDIDQQLLPDSITLPLLWLGISFNLFGQYTDLQSSVVGAIAGYLALWSIFHLFKLVTGKEGMGYGDFKLLAALGAWLGWMTLPAIILLSSFVGAIIGIALIAFRQHGRDIPIPFGPYLAAAGWLVLVWGEPIQALYLQWAGLA